MKSLILALLIMEELKIEAHKIYKFEPSLLACRKPEIAKYLRGAQCVYDTKHVGTNFLCKYRCDTNGFIRLKECQQTIYKAGTPLCEEIYCKEDEEELNTYDQCKFITKWDGSLICTFRCDDFNLLKLEECKANYLNEEVPLCEDLHCKQRN